MKKCEKERKRRITSMKRNIGRAYKRFCHFTGRDKNGRIKVIRQYLVAEEREPRIHGERWDKTHTIN
ncbi:hypothetical protein [Thermoanaerobacter ethanolicus]|uniref:hypothetical protein n=1 Tax=Thermoanaerobacter ethanolicus TaxID=1757 RepID=UPI001ABF82C6